MQSLQKGKKNRNNEKYKIKIYIYKNSEGQILPPQLPLENIVT